MGTFQGHLLPGLFFISFALWWTVQITKRKWICDMKGLPFYSTATYNGMWGKCLTLPAEGICKIVATVIGMALEVLASTAYGQAHRIVYWGDIQHVTMYLFFCISGIVDVLRHYKVVCIPVGVDYIMSALAFSVELVLFKFHLIGRSPMDVLVHTLLIYTIAGCVLTILIEYKYQSNLLAAYIRCFFVLLQGTWFIHVGFILYPPHPSLRHWNPEDLEQMMWVTMIFTWHLAVNSTGLFVIAATARVIYTRHCFIRAGCVEYDIVGAHIQRRSTRGRCENISERNPGGVHYDTLTEQSDDEIVYDQSIDK